MSEEQTLAEGEAEQKASTQGWVPLDEWKGNPAEWRSAEEFLKRGEEIGAHMRRDLQASRAQISTLQSQIMEMRQTFDEFRDFAAKSEERAYEKALKELKTKRRVALKEGEHEMVVDLEDEIEELQQSKPIPPVKKSPSTPQVDPLFLEWRSENPWFGVDPVMTASAEALASVIARETPGLIGRAFYDEVTKRTQRELPHKFGIRERPDAVSGGNGASSRSVGKKGRTYNDLPPEAKAQCDKFVAQKFVKTREEYCAAYDWS